ncbi:hypothetical protein SUGI_0851950 [Cryptomeria japonica]|nr:hypothetical protein SUGI_0851950 [Cryptomeria japonica]
MDKKFHAVLESKEGWFADKLSREQSLRETSETVVRELAELVFFAKPEDPEASLKKLLICTSNYLSLLSIWIHGINS